MSDRNASRAASFRFMAALCAAFATFSAQQVLAQGAGAPPPNLPNNDGADGVLRVCADPKNMPLSNKKGEGYENKIASQMMQKNWENLYAYLKGRSDGKINPGDLQSIDAK